MSAEFTILLCAVSALFGFGLGGIVGFLFRYPPLSKRETALYDDLYGRK